MPPRHALNPAICKAPVLNLHCRRRLLGNLRIQNFRCDPPPILHQLRPCGLIVQLTGFVRQLPPFHPPGGQQQMRMVISRVRASHRRVYGVIDRHPMPGHQMGRYAPHSGSAALWGQFHGQRKQPFPSHPAIFAPLCRLRGVPEGFSARGRVTYRNEDVGLYDPSTALVAVCDPGAVTAQVSASPVRRRRNGRLTLAPAHGFDPRR